MVSRRNLWHAVDRLGIGMRKNHMFIAAFARNLFDEVWKSFKDVSKNQRLVPALMNVVKNQVNGFEVSQELDCTEAKNMLIFLESKGQRIYFDDKFKPYNPTSLLRAIVSIQNYIEPTQAILNLRTHLLSQKQSKNNQYERIPALFLDILEFEYYVNPDLYKDNSNDEKKKDFFFSKESPEFARRFQKKWKMKHNSVFFSSSFLEPYFFTRKKGPGKIFKRLKNMANEDDQFWQKLKDLLKSTGKRKIQTDSSSSKKPRLFNNEMPLVSDGDSKDSPNDPPTNDEPADSQYSCSLGEDLQTEIPNVDEVPLVSDGDVGDSSNEVTNDEPGDSLIDYFCSLDDEVLRSEISQEFLDLL